MHTKLINSRTLISIFIFVFSFGIYGQYLWIDDYCVENSVAGFIPAPDGFNRVEIDEGSFEGWLRYLPVKRGEDTVYLYNGRPKADQSVHYAVIDIDTGERDLQQCADVVIRLIAEYLFFKNQTDKIAFNFTSGDRAYYGKWRNGYRPRVHGNSVTWNKTAEADSSYENFRRYLITVFVYAGSYSLKRELEAVRDIDDMKIGDIFIQGGFPGHAVIVVDMAEDEDNNRVFLLAQSYMPAQDFHILKNHNDEISPWYRVKCGEKLYTPEWVFDKGSLMRFKF